MNTIRRMLSCRRGVSAAEYALILAIVGAAIAVAAETLGNTIAGVMNNTGTNISSHT